MERKTKKMNRRSNCQLCELVLLFEWQILDYFAKASQNPMMVALDHHEDVCYLLHDINAV